MSLDFQYITQKNEQKTESLALPTLQYIEYREKLNMDHGRSRRQAARKAQRLIEVEQNIVTDYCHYNLQKEPNSQTLIDTLVCSLLFCTVRLILLRIQNFQLRCTSFLICWSLCDVDKSELSFTKLRISPILSARQPLSKK